MIVFAPLPTQGCIHLIKLTDVVFVCTQYVQLHIQVAGKKEFFGSWSTSFPQVTFKMNVTIPANIITDVNIKLIPK